MKRRHLLIFLLTFSFNPLLAQKPETENLVIELKKHHTADNEQLELLNKLSSAYANVQYDSGFAAVNRAIALAEKLNNKVQLAAAYNNKGNILLRKSQFEQSKEYFNKALSLYSSLQNKNGMADSYAHLAELDNWEGENADEMDKFIREALSLYEVTNNTVGIAQCNYLFARWNEFGDLDSAIIFNHLRKAIALFDKADNKTGKASALDFMGVTYDIHSDYANAFQYYQQAIDLNTLIGNLFGLCNDYINVSGCYFSINNYSKAIESAVKGLKLGEQLGDLDAQILMLGILGDTYNVTNQNDKGLQCLEQGYKMAVEIGSKKRMAHMLTSLHTIYMEQGNFPKAFESLYMVLTIDKEMNSSADMADDYTKLAEAYMKLSKFDSALVNYQHSFTLLNDIGENATYANNLLWYGKAINETPAAELKRAGINPDSRNALYKENINRALEVSSKIGVYSTQRDALLELSSISEAEDNLRKSLDYYKRYVALKDTIMNTENSNSINNLQIQYGTEKKEQQIVLLNKDNVIKQKEIGKQKVIRNGVIGGLSVVSGFLMLVFFQRNKIKTAYDDLKKTQKQLVQAEKMASVGQLTAGIAHEINNPINFVSANIGPLRRDVDEIMKLLEQYASLDKNNFNLKLDAILKYRDQIDLNYTIGEIKSLLNGIEEGSSRTAAIVKGLRNFSRLDEAEKKKADINEGIESTLVLLQNKLQQHNIEVVKSLGTIPEIGCYPGQLNQVFLNLLTNSIDAIPHEGKIFVTTSSEHNRVKISIRDTGAGMSDEVKKRLFDPFFTTKEIGKGTGLGLSISYGIIEKHNGKIEVKSEPGKGTEFIVLLPA